MATASFYEVACRSAQSAEVRALMAELLTCAQERERLQAEFTQQVLVNRTRREGKAPKASRAAREWMSEADEDARKAAVGQAQRIAKLADQQLLDVALRGWDTAIEFHNPGVYHEDDRAFAERIARHNKAARRRVKAFLRAHGMPIPALGSAGGIAFVTAFEHSIPDLGTLGADCMALEPALPALDRVAERAHLPPLSQFVHHDAHGLSGAAPEWFGADAGLATVRGLLEALSRSTRAVKNARKVVQDLTALETDVVSAQRNRVRFHFVMLD